MTEGQELVIEQLLAALKYQTSVMKAYNNDVPTKSGQRAIEKGEAAIARATELDTPTPSGNN